MLKELDVAFPPSGTGCRSRAFPLNHQPPDLLMQLLEYFFFLNRVMKIDAEAGVRPPELLMRELLDQLNEIKQRGGELEGGD